MAARAKKTNILAKQFAHAVSVSVHYRDLEYAYVYWIWLRGSASYVIMYLSGSATGLLVFLYYFSATLVK